MRAPRPVQKRKARLPGTADAFAGSKASKAATLPETFMGIFRRKPELDQLRARKSLLEKQLLVAERELAAAVEARGNRF